MSSRVIDSRALFVVMIVPWSGTFAQMDGSNVQELLEGIKLVTLGLWSVHMVVMVSVFLGMVSFMSQLLCILLSFQLVVVCFLHHTLVLARTKLLHAEHLASWDTLRRHASSMVLSSPFDFVGRMHGIPNVPLLFQGLLLQLWWKVLSLGWMMLYVMVMVMPLLLMDEVASIVVPPLVKHVVELAVDDANLLVRDAEWLSVG